MGFYSSPQLSLRSYVSTGLRWIDAARNARLPAVSAFAFPRYAILEKNRYCELQMNNLEGQFPIPRPAVQCHAGHPQDPETRQNITSSSFTKPSFSALTTLALALLCPSASLAETCTDNTGSIFYMPLLFGIALIGATVGGSLARQRRVELARLNNQLRQINAALKRQARIESYAPNLSYAPVGRSPDTETTIDTRRDDLILKLKEGKKYLRLQDPQKAFGEFKEAFELAQNIGDPTEAKKAARGMGASCQRQGKFREAIKYHSIVLSISEREQEHGGATDAYGAIADCYTELGDLETAGKFYDKYIERLETD